MMLLRVEEGEVCLFVVRRGEHKLAICLLRGCDLFVRREEVNRCFVSESREEKKRDLVLFVCVFHFPSVQSDALCYGYEKKYWAGIWCGSCHTMPQCRSAHVCVVL
jgi:hypothetical protein